MHERPGPIRKCLNCMMVAAFSNVSADRIWRVWVDWCASNDREQERMTRRPNLVIEREVHHAVIQTLVFAKAA